MQLHVEARRCCFNRDGVAHLGNQIQSAVHHVGLAPGRGRRMGVDNHHVSEFWNAAHGNTHTCIMSPKGYVVLGHKPLYTKPTMGHRQPRHMHVAKGRRILDFRAGKDDVFLKRHNLVALKDNHGQRQAV